MRVGNNQKSRRMRREASDVVVDDVRDEASAAGVLGAAMSGHVVTVSIAARDVASTVARLVSLCRKRDGDATPQALPSALRLIINQRLLRATDGRRTAVREFLGFDGTLRDCLRRTDPSDWPALTRMAVDEQGQSYAVAIRRAVAEGRIRPEGAAAFLAEVG
jgi:defect-in-organelle-trafficking protein DotB